MWMPMRPNICAPRSNDGRPKKYDLKSGYTQQLAQYEPRVFETQSLVEIWARPQCGPFACPFPWRHCEPPGLEAGIRIFPDIN
jgi:hypothetical protein